MKNRLLAALFLLGISFQIIGQTPVKGFEGSWNGTLEAAGTKLRIVLDVTKSDTGIYAGKFESLDQGATIPIDTITVAGTFWSSMRRMSLSLTASPPLASM